MSAQGPPELVDNLAQHIADLRAGVEDLGERSAKPAGRREAGRREEIACDARLRRSLALQFVTIELPTPSPARPPSRCAKFIGSDDNLMRYLCRCGSVEKALESLRAPGGGTDATGGYSHSRFTWVYGGQGPH